ncbi:MAG: U3 snoRNP protein [Bogoriella megaspora]|nr:MAG: U3 snoRNP protein [Bogoriella megaspora]
MAGASDKARFYLEKAVPELQDLERKKIFTKEEISSIAKRRSDFEHVLNARGSEPSDYARYAQYEMNLETLRRKRTKRMSIKVKNYTGPRRIFFVLDRGTRKFPGDLGLWIQYIEFAKKEKSYKKLGRIFSTVLRLHPTKPELWIYAAHYAMDGQADMTMARSYMQRGLRFCKKSKKLWIEYAKLEMMYMAKIVARQQILGLDQHKDTKLQKDLLDDPDLDTIALPEITVEDVNPVLATDDPVDDAALQNLAASPALSGAIPIAIFDAACNELNNDTSVMEQFFDMFAEFVETPSARKIVEHIVNTLQQTSPGTITHAVCSCRRPLVGIEPTSAEFPGALGESLDIFQRFSLGHPELVRDIAQTAVRLLLPLVLNGDLDHGVRRVLNASLHKYLMMLTAGSSSSEQVVALITRLEEDGKLDETRLLSTYIAQM